MKIKPFIFGIAGLLAVVGVLAGIKSLQIGDMINHKKQFKMPPEVVTVTQVRPDSWESLVSAVGSLEAVQGVVVTAEMSGRVVAIPFEPGTRVKAGDLLVQQDISAETAQLRAAEAAVTLASINYERSVKMLSEKVVARSNFDNADAQLKQAQAEVENIRAVIAKKTIRAPFSGRLGIRLVNVGQILKEGVAIVSLQAMDPIFVNFLVPQQQLAHIRSGLEVRVSSDALPGAIVQGKITAINPDVDTATRNIRIQATVANPDEALHPGMYVSVSVVQPVLNEVLILPVTAVLYAPYSDSIFIVESQKDAGGSTDGKVVRQQFVRLGEKRGDFIAVTSGVTADDNVVSTGVFKLRNGQEVVIDNTLQPEFKLAPQPKDN